jgi:hypothetical protein
MRWLMYVLLLALLLVAVSVPLAKQIELTQTGSIEGLVVDEYRLPIPNASIQAFHITRGETHTTLSTRNGWYRLTDLAKGRHSMWVQAPGYCSTWIPNVVVEEASATRQDFQLTRERTTEIRPTSLH